ncbi:MAG: hypothetical protein WD028_02600 [Balneolaceae bacterium]
MSDIDIADIVPPRERGDFLSQGLLGLKKSLGLPRRVYSSTPPKPRLGE